MASLRPVFDPELRSARAHGRGETEGRTRLFTRSMTLQSQRFLTTAISFKLSSILGPEGQVRWKDIKGETWDLFVHSWEDDNS